MSGFSVNHRVAAETAYGQVRSATGFGFQIREFALASGHEIEPHYHDAPVLVAVLDGSYEQVIGGVRVECLPGDVVVVPAADRHSERVGNAGSRCLLISPDAAVVSGLDRDDRVLERFQHVSHPTLARLARRIPQSWREDDSLTSLTLQSLSLDLLISLARVASGGAGSGPSDRPGWLARARSLLEDRFSEAVSLSSVAAELGVSQGHLARSFRQTFGLSVGEYLRERRLEEGERLLRETREPVARIALRSGFYDQSHFGNAFRRHYGASPAVYRSRLQPN